MKRVLTISRHYDIIKEDYSKLLDIFNEGEIKIKHTKKSKSFSILKIDMETIGILWFRSRDYSSMVENPSIFKNNVIKVFEFVLDNKKFNTFSIEQSKKVIDVFNLSKPGQVYYKFILEDDNPSLISEYIEYIGKDKGLCNRIQVDFAFDISLASKIQLASLLNTLGGKFGIKINSCNFKDFSNKNIWIGNEPCLSGYLMQELLDMKMMKVPQDSKVCPCHKNTDIFGAGEFFREGIDKVRKSDLNKDKLEKITKLGLANENKINAKKEKKIVNNKKDKNVEENLNDIELLL